MLRMILTTNSGYFLQNLITNKLPRSTTIFIVEQRIVPNELRVSAQKDHYQVLYKI